MLTSGVEVIPDADHERVYERVAAVDVAKATGMVCVRLPDEVRPGRRLSNVWEVRATMRSIIGLADHLVCQQIEMVSIESTSDYWRMFFYVFEVRGLAVQLVNARDVKQVQGRPKTDKHDAVWLAKLTEKGLLRPSFVPPASIRQLRDYTRMRVDLTHERTRYWQRLEKLLEDALIKVSSVASSLETVSARAMVEALIGGERDAKRLAELARGTMRNKRADLVEALTGQFDDHHAELARMLLDQIDALTTQIDRLTVRAGELLEAMPAAQPPGQADPSSATSEGEGRTEPTGPEGAHRQAGTALSTAERLDEITGIGLYDAQTILAEIGLDMSRFPTAGHLTSWAKLCPRSIQSGPKQRSGKVGKGNPYLKGVLGKAAATASRTDTFLGERYRRIVKRRGKLKALVAVARSILVIIWQLLSDPTARFHDLGSDYHTKKINTEKKIRSHIRQIQALGYQVTVTATQAT